MLSALLIWIQSRVGWLSGALVALLFFWRFGSVSPVRCKQATAQWACGAGRHAVGKRFAGEPMALCMVLLPIALYSAEVPFLPVGTEFYGVPDGSCDAGAPGQWCDEPSATADFCGPFFSIGLFALAVPHFG